MPKKLANFIDRLMPALQIFTNQLFCKTVVLCAQFVFCYFKQVMKLPVVIKL